MKLYEITHSSFPNGNIYVVATTQQDAIQEVEKNYPNIDLYEDGFILIGEKSSDVLVVH